MNYFFVFGSLVLAVVFFGVLILLKKVRAKKKYNLFSGEGGAFVSEGSFLKGILQGLIFKNNLDSEEKIDKNDLRKEGGGGYSEKEGSVLVGRRELVAGSLGGRGSSFVGVSGTQDNLLASRKKLESVIKKEKGSLVKSIEKIDEKKKVGSSINKIPSRVKASGGSGGIESALPRLVDPKKVLEEIKKTDLGAILLSLEKEEYSLVVEKIMKLNFVSKKDFVKTLCEELVNLLREANKELGFRASKIRKKGKNIRDVELKLMSVPLKIKIFEATYTKKDFDKVIFLMESLDKALGLYEDQNSEDKKVKDVA